MNTAVRRLLIIVCVAGATVCATSTVPLSAQTTKKTRTSTPQPTTVATDQAQANGDVPKSDQAATSKVSADTDKDASDPALTQMREKMCCLLWRSISATNSITSIFITFFHCS